MFPRQVILIPFAGAFEQKFPVHIKQEIREMLWPNLQERNDKNYIEEHFFDTLQELVVQVCIEELPPYHFEFNDNVNLEVELHREGDNGNEIYGGTMPIGSGDSIQDKVKNLGTPTKFVYGSELAFRF